MLHSCQTKYDMNLPVSFSYYCYYYYSSSSSSFSSSFSSSSFSCCTRSLPHSSIRVRHSKHTHDQDKKKNTINQNKCSHWAFTPNPRPHFLALPIPCYLPSPHPTQNWPLPRAIPSPLQCLAQLVWQQIQWALSMHWHHASSTVYVLRPLFPPTPRHAELVWH